MSSENTANSSSSTSSANNSALCKASFRNRKVAFFGPFAFWPKYHGGSPEEVARRCGALIENNVTADLDFLVLGDRRGTGRAEAKKKGERLERSGSLKVLDEAAYREAMRIEVTGKSFCFAGGFDCCPKDFDEDLLGSMVTSVQGVLSKSVDASLDYLVLGNRRGVGKTSAERTARELIEAGGKITILDEEGFLEFVRKDLPSGGGDGEQLSFASLIRNFYGFVSDKKMQRALKMLQTERFQLYANITDDNLCGVVKSQTQDGTYYAPWLNSKGQYGCYSHELAECMGLQGSVCKHLLVLVIGLVRTGQLSAETASQWISTCSSKKPKSDQALSTEALLQYKGVIAGEIDWRPTETVPEDFYTF